MVIFVDEYFSSITEPYKLSCRLQEFYRELWFVDIAKYINLAGENQTFHSIMPGTVPLK